jgi:threonine/homoserine/homoserine lactone efflux protein
MATLPFLLAVWALLLTPGPTNTLMALSGAQVGWRGTVRLLPVELIAYLIVILPVAMLGAQAMADFPMLAQTIRLGAASWVLYLAVTLWRTPTENRGEVSARRLFVTTLLNPKGLIVALALLPPPRSTLFVPHLLVFAGSVLLVALLWAGLGAQVGGDRRWLRRAAASWLALLSGGLALGAMPH